MLSNTLPEEPFSSLFDFGELSSSLKKTPKARRLCCPQAGYPLPLCEQRLLIFYMLRVSRKSSHCSQAQRKMALITPVTRTFLRFCANYAEINKSCDFNRSLMAFFHFGNFLPLRTESPNDRQKGHNSPLDPLCTAINNVTNRFFPRCTRKWQNA